LIGVGVYDEYFKKPKAGILMLNNIRIKVGDEIYAHKGGYVHKLLVFN